MSFSMTDTAKTSSVFSCVFRLLQCEVCYFSPHGPGCFCVEHRCSGNEVQRQHLCDTDPGLLCNILYSYCTSKISLRGTLTPSPLCSSTQRFCPSIWEFGIKGKQCGAPSLAGKAVLNGQVPLASLFRSILRIHERSFAGLQEAGAPQHPSCKIHKWTVDFSGASVSYF